MAKKYTIPFKSLNGKTCRIDIYDPSYNGTAVTTLTGAPQPITFDEDDDDDLLTVVRTKTGYLNLIETTAGELDDIYPTTNTSRKVMAYYDSQLIFTGFIQAQSFQNKWVSSPRQVSLPIMSPLALIDDIDMPIYNPPSTKALNVLLADVVDMLNDMGAEYTSVVWPKMDVLLTATVSSLTVCPFSSNHDPAYANTPLFESNTAGWFIEALCNAFGWMVHETPTELVFTKFDHTGKYMSCNVTNLRTLSGASELGYDGSTQVAITDYVTPADGDGEVSSIMPKEYVELSYDGEYVKSSRFDFSHLTFQAWETDHNQYVAWLRSDTPELTGSKLSYKNYFDNAGKLTQELATACSCGSASEQTECILVNLPNSTVHSTELFTIKFFDRPTAKDIQFKCQFKWGDIILNLDTDDDVNHKALGIKVKVGNQYYQGGGVWSTTVPNPFGVADNPTDISWNITNTPEGMPIEVSFYEITATVANRVPLIAVVDPEIEEMPIVYSDYRIRQRETDKIGIANGYGNGSATVGMGLNCYRYGSNQIGSTLQSPRFTDYTYLLYSQERLRIRFRITYTMSYWWYFIYATFVSHQWRVIGISQNPYDDEYEIIFHRSLNA